MSSFNKSGVNKILIIKNDHIGDIILSSNVFREIRNAFPKSHITLICSKSNYPIVEKNKNIDRIMPLDFSPRKPKELFKYFKTSRFLKKQNFDLGIDLRGGFLNILFLLYLPRVKHRVGFHNQHIGKYFLHYAREKTHWTKFERGHVTNERLYLINKALGLNSTNNWPEIATDNRDKLNLQNLLKEKKLKDFICINPDTNASKQWPINNFDQLIKLINKKYPSLQIVLVGADEKIISFLHKNNPKTIPIIKENLRVVYLLFQKSKLMIGHDGGPVHLSWVGGSKTLDLIEKRLPLNWIKPLGKNSHYIYEELKTLPVKKVFNKVNEILMDSK